jgi:hypothetical protein
MVEKETCNFFMVHRKTLAFDGLEGICSFFNELTWIK